MAGVSLGLLPRPAALQLLLALSFAVACADAPAPPAAPTTKVAYVELAPVDPEIFVGGSLRLEAYPTDPTGLDLEGRRARWWSGDEKVATVNSSGLVYGVAVGRTVIAVDVEGVQASVLLRVVPAPIGRVAIEPDALDLLQGRWTRLEATAVDIWGQPMPVESFEWSSSAPEIVQVDGEGRVDALQPGTATIFAATSGVEGSASVLVRQNPVAEVVPEVTLFEIYTGRDRQLHAVALDQEGNVLPGTRISWHSKDPQVASVESGGLLRAWRPGLAKLVAAAGPVEAKVEAVVLQMEVVRIELPASARVVVEETLQLTPSVIGSDGEPIFGRQVHWSSSDPAVASVDGVGQVTGHELGEVTITATVEGASVSCVLIVEPPPPYLVRLEVETSMWLREGENAPFPVVAIDQYGQPMSGVFFSFSSSNPIAVTVVDGVARGWQAGNATITTSARGLRATTAVVVLPPLEVGEVEIVVPDGERLLVGESRELTAIVRGTDGAILNPWPVSWVSSNSSVASVEDGVVTALATGRVTITATADGVSGETELVVEALRFRQVDVADEWSCGLTLDGRIFCWGRLPWLQPALRLLPAQVPTVGQLDIRFRQISVGDRHLCAVVTPGDAAYCVGDGSHGQLGNNSVLGSPVLSPVSGGLRFRQIAAGSWHSCGVTLDGEGYCWGAGPLGTDPPLTQALIPTGIDGALDLRELGVSSQGQALSLVDPQDALSCGITTDGAAHCWGANGKGRLGTGAGADAPLPAPVGGGISWKAIAVATSADVDAEGTRVRLGHGCGVSDGGQAYCWGWNALGQLGNGSLMDSLAPVAVAGTERFLQIAVGTTADDALSCGITTEYQPRCWGSNRAFLLGDGDTSASLVPAPIPGGLAFTSIAVGAQHACALGTTGLIYCWGMGQRGLIGIPSPPTYVVVPTPIFGQLAPAP